MELRERAGAARGCGAPLVKRECTREEAGGLWVRGRMELKVGSYEDCYYLSVGNLVAF